MNPSHSVAISSSTAISYLSCSCTRTHRMPTKLDPFRSPAGSHRRDIDEGWWPVSLTPPNTRTHARAYWSTGVYDSKVRRMFDNAWVDSWIGAPVTSDYRLRMRIYEGSSVATTGMSLIHKLSVKWGLRWRFRNARLRAVSTVANERRTGLLVLLPLMQAVFHQEEGWSMVQEKTQECFSKTMGGYSTARSVFRVERDSITSAFRFE